MSTEQLFLVQHPEGNDTTRRIKMVTLAVGREDAKRKARYWMGGNPDEYIVTPITNPGDILKVDITLI